MGEDLGASGNHALRCAQRRATLRIFQFAIFNFQFAIGCHAGQQPLGMLGNVAEQEPALAFFRPAAAAGDQPRQPAVGGPIGCPQDYRRGVGGGDFRADARASIPPLWPPRGPGPPRPGCCGRSRPGPYSRVPRRGGPTLPDARRLPEKRSSTWREARRKTCVFCIPHAPVRLVTRLRLCQDLSRSERNTIRTPLAPARVNRLSLQREEYKSNQKSRARTSGRRPSVERPRSVGRRPSRGGNNRVRRRAPATTPFRSAPAPTFAQPGAGCRQRARARQCRPAAAAAAAKAARGAAGFRRYGRARPATAGNPRHHRHITAGQLRLGIGNQPHPQHHLAAQPVAEPIDQSRQMPRVSASRPPGEQLLLPHFQRGVGATARCTDRTAPGSRAVSKRSRSRSTRYRGRAVG